MTHYTNLENSPIRQAKCLASNRWLCIIAALLFSVNIASGQALMVWTGNASNEFHDPLNWVPSVPPAGNYLLIAENGGNAPVVSTAIVVHNMAIGADADLTVEEGANLGLIATFAPHVGRGILYNQGTILNQGTISIIGGANEPYSINNEGTITLETTFPGGIASTALLAIFDSDGIGIYSSGTFTNRGGEIDLGTATIQGDGIYVADGLFNNISITFPIVSTGRINIRNTTGDGIAVHSNGIFTLSSGTVTLGDRVNIGSHGIDNEGNFNGFGGTIDIPGVDSSGLHNQAGATFTNTRTSISIGTTANNVEFGIHNYGTFFNEHTIDIQRAEKSGIDNHIGSQFTNRPAGSITVGSAEAVGVVGIINAGAFTNRGTIDIESTTSIGLYNLSENASFENLGGSVLNIGTTGGGIGIYGLYNNLDAAFINNASTINIGNTGTVDPGAGFGIYNTQSASFSNENGAFINIGQNSNGVSSAGILFQNSSSFINRNSTIKIDNTGGSGLQGSQAGTFQNLEAGLIDIGQSEGNITGSGLLLIGAGAIFFNDASTVNIDHGEMGVDLQQNADFNNQNAAQLNVGVNGGLNSIDFYGFSIFGNLSNTGSTINVNNTRQSAIFLAEGAIINDGNGQINIGTSGEIRNISNHGILCRAFFQNFDGTIQINNINQNGVVVTETGRFINDVRGTLNIGTNGSNYNINASGINIQGIFQNRFGTINIEQTGDHGILLDGIDNPIFTNVINGNINIADTDEIGLWIRDGTFNNSANLTIGNTNGEAIMGINNSSFDNGGGTLKVDGRVRNITAIEGTIAPGNSPGEMSSFRALDISDATLEIEVDGKTPITQHDVLDVNGVATIGNATLTMSASYAPTTNDRIVFLKANSISGTFSSASLPDYWELDYSVSGEVAVVYNDVSCLLSAKVFLQGPYNTTTALLNDDLRTTIVMPLVEPYSGMSGFTHINGGGESIGESILNVSGNNAMVDWIFVELRDATDPSVVLHTRAAILQRDGDIVDVTGVNDPVVFPLAPIGDYYVTVRHRNHVGIRSVATLNLDKLSATSYDFTSASSQANGTDPMVEVSTGVWAMWGGNAKSDDNYVRVTPRVFPPPSLASDRTYILDDILNGNPNGTFTGYSNGDINMDGHVRLTPRVFPPPSLESDATFILDEVLDGDPNGTRTEQ